MSDKATPGNLKNNRLFSQCSVAKMINAISKMILVHYFNLHTQKILEYFTSIVDSLYIYMIMYNMFAIEKIFV